VEIGELHCLCCARHLADVLRDTNGQVQLDHPSGQATKPVLAVQRQSRLYCARCGGNALFEPALDAAYPPQRLTINRELQEAS
jgi:hypothetical protein